MKASDVMDPEVFLAVDDLELVARGLVDSVWSGRHGAARSGPGTEFLKHRPYSAGDDLRRINWALFARHRQLFTKESRMETTRPVYIMLDITGSMNVGNGPWTKIHYASRIAAALAWLAHTQGDGSALALLRDGLESVLEPSGGQRQCTAICATLASAQPCGEGDWPRVLLETGMLCRKPGFVIWISDFLNHEEETLQHLSLLQAYGHDVMAMQVLDPVEVRIPKDGDYNFLETEAGGIFRLSVESVHQRYAKNVAAWREGLEKAALHSGLTWASTTTAEPITEVLRRWLDLRLR